VISGLSLVAMGMGGLIAGLAVALLSGAVSRYTPQPAAARRYQPPAAIRTVRAADPRLNRAVRSA
jgi:Tfp pilus assembly protein FimV